MRTFLGAVALAALLSGCGTNGSTPRAAAPSTTDAAAASVVPFGRIDQAAWSAAVVVALARSGQGLNDPNMPALYRLTTQQCRASAVQMKDELGMLTLGEVRAMRVNFRYVCPSRLPALTAVTGSVG